MARTFSDFQKLKEDLRVHADLVNVIEHYGVTLTLRGTRWVGFCPFHDDKNNPGLAVSPDAVYDPSQSKGVWGCWTCGAHGDLYAFVQRIHDASFYESIEIIAEISKFNLEPYYRELTAAELLRESQYRVVEELADRFCDQLLATPRKLKKFLDRGITEETIRAFKVGYSPSLSFFNAETDGEVRTLVEPKRWNRERLFDDRILYAQFTTSGQVWGWSARQPDNRPPEVPKYIVNSDEAPLFDGHGRLYGFSQARQLLRKSQLPYVIVEGFNDALAVQQAGIAAIAACGNQFSKKQEETLREFSVREAIVCFDPDEGGRDGMLALAMKAHLIKDVRLKFADVELEPEEYLQKYTPETFRGELLEAKAPIDYIISSQAEILADTPTHKRNFLEHIQPFLKLYPQRSVDRALGVQAVSKVTGLSEDSISDFLDEHSDNPLANLVGEMIVLAELVQNPEAWLTLGVQRGDFSLRRYIATFTLMEELYENEAEVNVELLQTHAINSNASQEVIETIAKLSSIARKTPEIFARDIHDKAVRRRAEHSANLMANQSRDLRTPINETVAGFMDDITQAMNRNTQKMLYSSIEAVASTSREIERRALGETTIAGLDLGPDWKWFTEQINGFQGKSTHGIGAFSTVGKSLILTNWIHKLSVVDSFGVNYPAPKAAGLIVSMEMTKEDLVMRLAAIDAGIPHSYISHSRFDSEEQGEEFYASLDRIQAARLNWMEDPQSLREIAMQARLLQAKGELDYIALDYIQLLDLTPYSDRWSITEKYNQASQEMTELAKSLNIPFIFAAQLNRGAAIEDVPTGSQVGSAIKIYQDAHIFFILAERETGIHGSLDKNRRGGKGHVSLSFDRNPQTSTLRVYEKDILKPSSR